MKKLTYIVLGLMMAVTIPACKNFLEIKPDNVILDEDAITSPDDLRKLLASCYDAARSDKFYGGSLIYFSDFMADDIDGTLFTGNWGAIYGHRTSKFISDLADAWQDAYLVIYRSNITINKIEEFPDISADRKKLMIAEAKFLRAISHFEIVRLYGQPYGKVSGSKTYTDVQSGVPIRLVPDQAKILRSSTADVYVQVLKDLDEAIADLPSVNPEGNYADVWAAKAYKARVLFQKNDIDGALALCNDIINNSGRKLNTDLSKRYAAPGDTANHEVLFGLYSQRNQFSALISQYKSRPNPGIILSTAVLAEAKTEAKDIRDSVWFKIDKPNTPSQRIFSEKFGALPSSQREIILPIIHMTEITLMRAECNTIKRAYTEALADLNKIRRRAKLDDYTSSISSALLNEIRRQRRIEMFGEGNRLHEIKRIGAFFDPNFSFVKINGNQIKWDCPGMIMQIPNSEDAGNIDIELNEQYGCE